jgi:hypothetical protein
VLASSSKFQATNLVAARLKEVCPRYKYFPFEYGIEIRQIPMCGLEA